MTDYEQLCNCIKNLDDLSFSRLREGWRKETSIWAEICRKCGFSEKRRQWAYGIWKHNRKRIRWSVSTWRRYNAGTSQVTTKAVTDSPIKCAFQREENIKNDNIQSLIPIKNGDGTSEYSDSSIPVACKSCRCGHSFSTKNRNVMKCEDTEDYTDIKIRRTERTKRVPPDFFNSLEYGSPFHRRRQKKDSESSVSESPRKRKRGRPKGALKKTKSESDKDTNKTDTKPTEEDKLETLSTEKALQCSIILAELNRKFMGQSFKPL